MTYPYPIDVVAAALDLTPGSDGNYIGSCLIHDDEHPSLSVKLDAVTGKLIVSCFAGCDQAEVYKAVTEKTDAFAAENGVQPQDETSSKPFVVDNESRKAYRREVAVSIWEDADFKTDIVSEYLKGRGLSGAVPDSIRQTFLEYVPGSGETYPCMVAAITDANNEIVGIHRTFLMVSPDGSVSKAPVEAPKKILGTMKDNFIQLSDEYLETLHLAEGIETSLAIKEAIAADVRVCMAAQNLASAVIPADVEIVYIWADLDRSGTGQKFAEIAAKKLTEQGKKVFLLLPGGTIPEGEKSIDWLDMGKDAIKAAFATAKPFGEQNQPWSLMTIPDGYDISNNGVYLAKPKANGGVTQELVATGPIWLAGARVDLATQEVEIKLSWFDKKRRVTSRWLSRGQILKSTTLIDLTNVEGFPSFGGIVDKLVRFLALLEKGSSLTTELIARQPGWARTADDHIFVCGNNDGEVIFYPEEAYRPYASALASAGSFEAWLEVVKPTCEKFPIVLFSLLAVHVPPTLRITGAPNFIVNYWGDTSTGKTSCLEVIFSAWGKPSNPGGLIFSFNNTGNFSERLAAFFSDLPLAFDDAQTASDKIVELIIYMIANGIGKGRAKPYSIAKTEAWRSVLFITSEKPATEKAFPGAIARTLGIPESPFAGIEPESLQIVKSCVQENYGHLARKFIQILMQFNEKDLRQSYNGYVHDYMKMATNEFGNRFASYFASVRVVAEIMCYLPEMRWIRPLICDSIQCIWNLANVDITETNMGKKALTGIAAWIESNKRHFAREKCQTELQPTYGMIRQQDGFVAIIPHVFKQALRDLEIQSSAAVIAQWKRQGILIFTPGRNQKQIKVEGEPVWCVCISYDALYPKTGDVQPEIQSTTVNSDPIQSSLPN